MSVVPLVSCAYLRDFVAGYRLPCLRALGASHASEVRPAETKLAILGGKTLRHELPEVDAPTRQLVTCVSSQLLTTSAPPSALPCRQSHGRV